MQVNIVVFKGIKTNKYFLRGENKYIEYNNKN